MRGILGCETCTSVVRRGLMFPYLYAQETDGDPLLFGTYGLMLVTAFLLAALISGSRMGKVGINPDVVVPLIVVTIVSSIFGARLLHFLGSPGDRERFLENPLILLDLTQGGMAVMGGVSGAIIFGWSYLYFKGVNPWKVADIAGPSTLLGQAIGRMGCFFAGCCHGQHVPDSIVASTLLSFPGGDVVSLQDKPYVAYEYHRTSGPQDFGAFPDAQQGMGALFDVPLYPVQTYEAIGALIGFGLLSLAWRYGRKFDGQIMGMYLICYAGLRYMVEMFRGDAVRGTAYLTEYIDGGLSTSQVTSLVFVGAGILYMVVSAFVNKGIKPEKAYAPDSSIEDELIDELG